MILPNVDSTRFNLKDGPGKGFFIAELEISGEINNLSLPMTMHGGNLYPKQRNEYEQGQQLLEQLERGGESQVNEAEQNQRASGEKQLATDIAGKIRSLRASQDPVEQERLESEIIEETGKYLLNREGIIVGDEASFADKSSDTFFNLIDEGKSVYLLSPNTKIAETPEHFKQTAHLGGFDGVRLMEIDGTNSTIQITNFDKLTHVIG